MLNLYQELLGLSKQVIFFNTNVHNLLLLSTWQTRRSWYYIYFPSFHTGSLFLNLASVCKVTKTSKLLRLSSTRISLRSTLFPPLRTCSATTLAFSYILVPLISEPLFSLCFPAVNNTVWTWPPTRTSAVSKQSGFLFNLFKNLFLTQITQLSGKWLPVV